MASPETGTSSPVGSWMVIQPGLPAFITDIAQAISSFAQALITILNILLTILGIIKAFLIGFTNPLIAIIEAIINEIEALLNDLRQIGLYISGDLVLESPFEEILGGYAACERRFIARLVDRTDPTRPAFTSRTAVLGVFMYLSADSTTIYRLTEFIRQVMAFFGQFSDARNYTTPVGLGVKYGEDGTSLGAFQQNISDLFESDVEPNAAQISWQMAAPPKSSPVSLPIPAPKGFLVEVSTLRDGLIIAANAPIRQAEREPEEGLSRRTSIVIGPDKRPFRLYGGYDQFDLSQTPSYNRSISTIKSNDTGAAYFYAYKDNNDNAPIPLDMLKDGTKYLLQRTFYVPGGLRATLSGPGQGFSTVLTAEDMPYEAEFEVDSSSGEVSVTVSDEPATTVYVRVAAVTKNVESEKGFQWQLEAGQISAGVQAATYPTLQVANGLNPTDRGPVSSPLVVTFPGTETQNYLTAVQTALAVLVLSRSDLTVEGIAGPVSRVDIAASETGLEDLGRYLIPEMLGNNPAKFFKREGIDSAQFRKKLLRKCRVFANYLYEKTGPFGTSIESLVVEQGQALLDFKWSDHDSDYPEMTILESLGKEAPYYGVALNPLSLANTPSWCRQRTENLEVSRSPAFFGEDGAPFQPGMQDGSADYSPVVWAANDEGNPTTLEYCRNVFLGYEDGALLTAAIAVLNVAGAPLTLPKDSKGAWTAVRLLPQGLPPVEQALDEILNWLKSINIGISGIIELIKAYIEFIETRLLEIQSIIERINNLLQSLLALTMPQVAGLIVTANGTDGILQALISAENKPTDPPTTAITVGELKPAGTYGAGITILAGGLPSAIVEILKLFFPESDEGA